MSVGQFKDIAPGSAGKVFSWQADMEQQGACSPCTGTTADDSAVGTLLLQGAPAHGQAGDPRYFDMSDAYVQVSFGAESTSAQAFEMDLGCAATFPASQLTVMCQYPKVPKTAPVAQPLIAVSASWGRGSIGQKSPTRTVQLTELLRDTDTTDWLVIPQFAVDVTQIRLDSDLDAPVNFWLEYSMYPDAAGVVKEATLNTDAYTPVPKLARYYRVTNMIPLGGQYGAVQFRLQL